MNDYGRRALEAETLARRARDSVEREQLLQVARLWRDRAEAQRPVPGPAATDERDAPTA